MSTLPDDIDLSRRHALQAFALAGAAVAVSPASAVAAPGGAPDWARIRLDYPTQQPFLNLNNAAVSPGPLVVQAAVLNAYRFANIQPDLNMWSGLDDARPMIKSKLARLIDCDPAEIALNRNSTEGLCTAIFGIPLQPGDEVLICEWDYPSMRRAWLQRAKREAIVVRQVDFDLMSEDDAIVEAYRRALTPKTRVMQLTHMVHYTGRVLPIERLCSLAREHEVQTIVDAAQSFAQTRCSFRQFGCDYLAVSLHKWLCAPLGTGMLVVKASRIDNSWPLFAPFDDAPVGIEKLDHWNLGTYCSPLERAIEPAIDYHNRLGTDAKHARLAELTRHWVERASDIKGFHLHTPVRGDSLSAISLFSIDGIEPEAIEKRLQDEFKIHVRFRRQAALAGVRVSPHIYTSFAELDHFVSALKKIARTA